MTHNMLLVTALMQERQREAEAARRRMASRRHRWQRRNLRLGRRAARRARPRPA